MLLILVIPEHCPRQLLRPATLSRNTARPFTAIARKGRPRISGPQIQFQSIGVSARKHFTKKTDSIVQLQNSLDESIDLQSSTSFSAAVAASIVLVAATTWLLWDTGTARDTRSRLADIDTMAYEAAPGHHGNLTAEQEEKLRKLWAAVFRLCGVDEAKAAGLELDNPPASKDQEPTTESETSAKRGGFSFLRKSKQADSPSTSTGGGASADDDKYGLTKQYQQMLASQEPEELRQTIWEMMKHDHPDALLLRFLRARKWDVEKALVMFISALHWRHSKMKVDQDIMKRGEGGAVADEKSGDSAANKLGHGFMVQCRMGKSFLHGVDKEGRPICVVRVRLHKSSDQAIESLERYTVHIIETARLALKAPVDTAVSLSAIPPLYRNTDPDANSPAAEHHLRYDRLHFGKYGLSSCEVHDSVFRGQLPRVSGSCTSPQRTMGVPR